MTAKSMMKHRSNSSKIIPENNFYYNTKIHKIIVLFNAQQKGHTLVDIPFAAKLIFFYLSFISL